MALVAQTDSVNGRERPQTRGEVLEETEQRDSPERRAT